MKKILSLVIAVACFSNAGAQYVGDAIKFSQNFPTLTARSLGMGNALTSLGGDFASVTLNPAGLGLYRKSEFVISPSLDFTSTKSNFYGISTNGDYRDFDHFGDNNEDVRYQFNLGSIGYVGTYLSGKSKGLVSASYALGYNRINNFNSSVFLSGINDSTSLVDYFFDGPDGQGIQGLHPDQLDDFSGYIAFQTFLIDTIPGTFDYDTPVLLPVDQRRSIDTRGGTGHYTFGFGLNFSDVWYVGMNLGVYHLSYEQTTRHTEFDATPSNDTDFDNFTQTERLDVEGNGFSMSFGTMVRLAKIVRLGASVHLPTFYRISEAYRTAIISEFDQGDSYDFASEGAFRYKLTTPLRLQGGASIQIGQAGIFAADIDYIDYSSMTLRERDDEFDFSNSNDAIEDVYKPVVNVKLGGEARVMDKLFLRLGGGYYPSPYTSEEFNKDASRMELNAGIGYRSSSFFIDFGFSTLFHEEKYHAYSAFNYLAPNNYVNNIADLDQNKFRFVTSVGFRF